jgi:hypothetical protein
MVGGPRTWEAMEGDDSKAMEGDRCVYGRWAIYITSSLIAFEIEGD